MFSCFWFCAFLLSIWSCFERADSRLAALRISFAYVLLSSCSFSVIVDISCGIAAAFIGDEVTGDCAGSAATLGVVGERTVCSSC